jgi:hypothetical protein
MLVLKVKKSLAHDPQTEQGSQDIAMTLGLLEKNVVVAKVNGYHLIFDLNGVLMVTREGSTRFHPMVLRLVLKKFVCTCVKKSTIYI